MLFGKINPHTLTLQWATIPSIPHNQPTTSFPWSLQPKISNADIITEHLSTLQPFSAPPAPTLSKTIQSPVLVEESMELTSTLRKRRLKMNKHKHKKLRKRTRALRKRLGK
ncbi:unnamed protein product [Cunninghamella echinulata]